MLHHIHLPEPLTLAATMLLVILLTSMNYLIIWFQNRQQAALLWMLFSSLLSSFAFALRLVLADRPGNIIATTLVMIATACIWMGCRATAGRRPWLPSLLIPGAIWLLICCIPGFFDRPSLRYAVPYLFAVPLLALALRELWPAEQDRRLARGIVSALLVIEALLCFGWGTAQVVSVICHLGLDRHAVDLPFSGFSIMGFTLIMSFAFVALIKEQSDWAFSQTALQDSLTGLGNRRRLDALLETAVRASHRSGAPLAMLMIDVDSFKTYNDRYGHAAGDICLRAVARALRGGLIRRGDEVLRYGGEEFAVILADTREVEAIAVAERLRLAVRALNLPHEGRPDGIVTISLGVAVMQPGARDIADALTLIDAADGALYRAKEAGRDGVGTVAAPPAEPPAVVLPAPSLRLDPA